MAPGSRSARRISLHRKLVSFCRNFDLDDITCYNPAGLHESTQGHTEIVAVDLSSGLEADDILTRRAFHAAHQFGLQGNFVSDAANRQVTEHVGMSGVQQLDTRALKGYRGMVRDIQKLGAFHVLIAQIDPRMQAGSCYFGLQRGTGRISLIEEDGAAHVLEVALDGSNHHMFDSKLDLRMVRIKLPEITSGRNRSMLCCHISTPPGLLFPRLKQTSEIGKRT